MSVSTRIIPKTIDHVKVSLTEDASGHGWQHIRRVWQMARRLTETEGGDRTVVELAALLHDIADWKFHDGDLEAGPRAAKAWLESLEVDQETIEAVCHIVRHLSFKGAGVPDQPMPLEGQIVQDADRLDAIGAIGIARTFAYGGHKGQPIDDPDLAATPHESFATYQSSPGTSINHFHEKLLLLKDRMHTASARAIAEERHAYMEEFLRRFAGETAPCPTL